MNKFKILVDIDETLTNLLQPWVNSLNLKYWTDVSVENIKDWDLSKAFNKYIKAGLLTRDNIYEELTNEDVWKNVTVRENAQQILKKLIQDGHDVFICSATSPATASLKDKYVLKRYFNFVNERNIIFTYSKHMINADILIDDKFDNVFKFNGLGILVDHPYNRSELTYVLGYDNIIRSTSWDKTYEIINFYSKHAVPYHSTTIKYRLPSKTEW